MDGGGSSAPSSQTITQSNIPDWMRPQVESLIGGASNQLFNFRFNPETGKDEMTGVKSYVPYSANPEDYVADLSPLQRMAMQGAVNAPGMAQQMMQQGMGAGSEYAKMATDPNSIQAYMSPYMQNVVDLQQQNAQRNADIASQARGAQFASQGAFGGARQGIENAQANAALQQQKQMIQATGLQSAFENAQKAQQFGAGLGLQGLDRASRSYNDMLGGINLQSGQGAVEQQQQQNIINRAVGNYDTAQQYPMQQFQQMNGLLRGYYTPSTTTTSYTAGPTAAQQVASAGATAYGMSKLRKGGEVRMAAGGLSKIDEEVLSDPTKFSEQQLRQSMQNGVLNELIGNIALARIAQARKSAAGVSALPSNLPEQGFAPGGIVAFAGDTDGSLVQDPEAWDRPLMPYGEQMRNLTTFPGRLFSTIVSDPALERERIAAAKKELAKKFAQNKGQAFGSYDQAALPASVTPAAAPTADAAPTAPYKLPDQMTPQGVAALAASMAGRSGPGITMADIDKRLGAVDTSGLNKTPEQLAREFDATAEVRQASADAKLRPGFNQYLTTANKANDEALQEQEKYSQGVSDFRRKQEEYVRKNEATIAKDREQAVGLAWLQAAKAMSTGRKPIVSALADAAATGGEHFARAKEKLDARAEKLQEALMRIEEARAVNDPKIMIDARKSYNAAKLGFQKEGIDFNMKMVDLGRADAKMLTEQAQKNLEARISTQLAVAKAGVDAGIALDRNDIQRQQMMVEAVRAARANHNPQLEIMTVLGGGDPRKGYEFMQNEKYEPRAAYDRYVLKYQELQSKDMMGKMPEMLTFQQYMAQHGPVVVEPGKNATVRP